MSIIAISETGEKLMVHLCILNHLPYYLVKWGGERGVSTICFHSQDAILSLRNSLTFLLILMYLTSDTIIQ